MTRNRLRKLPTHRLAALYRKTYTEMKTLYANLSEENIDEAMKKAIACATYKKELKLRKDKKS
jgi:hypothetical protein